MNRGGNPRPEVPQELTNLLLEFTVSVLVHKPNNLVEYAANYFQRLYDDQNAAAPSSSSAAAAAATTSTVRISQHPTRVANNVGDDDVNDEDVDDDDERERKPSVDKENSHPSNEQDNDSVASDLSQSESRILSSSPPRLSSLYNINALFNSLCILVIYFM